jgi:hypothetical protein
VAVSSLGATAEPSLLLRMVTAATKAVIDSVEMR